MHRLAALLLLATILAAGEARVVCIGIWDRSEPILQQAAAAAGVRVDVLPSERFAGDQAPDLAGYRLALVLNLDPVAAGRIVERWKEAHRDPACALELVALDQRGSHAPLKQAGALVDDPRIPPYWRANGAVNLARMLDLVATAYLSEQRAVKPPVEVPEWGYHLPGHEEPTTRHADLAAGMGWTPGAPVAAVLIQQSFWITKDTAVSDLLADRLRAAGMNPAILFVSTAGQLSGMLRELKPDVIVEDRHGTMWDDGDGRSLLEELDATYTRPVSMMRSTVADWRASRLGLAPADVALCQILQECAGAIEPVVIGGLQENVLGFRLHEPIRERIDRFAARAAAWARLRHAANADKRVALVSYNKGVGKGDLLRGSPTGAFLDGPRSLLAFLARLKQEGYDLPAPPADERALVALFQDHARNVAPWDQAELEAMADRPEAILVEAATLERWLSERLTPGHLRALEQHFGKPPGRMMVVERNGGRKYVVLPALRLGKVLLAVQPERGERMDEALLHSRDIPPPYHYLAFYWWLQEEFKADAVIHFGTHGSLELLPGRENGLGPDDWSDLCAGTMPIIDLWVMDNLGEATLARRRSYARLVDHLVPPALRDGLSPEEQRLAEDLRKHAVLDTGTLKQGFRTAITAAARSQGLSARLRLVERDGVLDDASLERLADTLHERQEAATPETMHVLGQAPPDAMIAAVVADSLGRALREAVAPGRPLPEQRTAALAFARRSILGSEAADPAVAALIAQGRDLAERVRGCRAETDALVHALAGGFTRPGPGPDPVRNPASVPTGRNLFALNPEEIPTRASWEVARGLVAQLLAKRRPGKVAIDLSGMSTMQDFGVTEAQILHFIGVEPVWAASGIVADVRLIPRAELGRARVDVFVAMGGHYRENFPSRLRLLDKALRLAAASPEEDNPLRSASAAMAGRLRGRGIADADALSTARIFGTKPGNLSGTNILYLVPRSGAWKEEGEITSIYIDNMSFVYGGGRWGEKVDGLYEEALQGTDTIVHTWSSHLTSPLSNHHVYEYLGGLSMAVKAVTGHEAEAFIADTRDSDGARLRGFDEVLDTTLQSELLSKRWIAGMQEHGYAGAGHIAELVQNTFGWNATRASALPGGVWDDIDAIYRQDRFGLDLPAWMERENPDAWQETLATMIEATRKGYWKPSRAVLDDLCERYARSVAQHGGSGGLVSGGNRDLVELVAGTVAGLGKQPLAAAFRQKATAKPATPETAVRGEKLAPRPAPSPTNAAQKPAPKPAAAAPGDGTASPWRDRLPWAIAVLILLAIAVGVVRRTGIPGARP